MASERRWRETLFPGSVPDPIAENSFTLNEHKHVTPRNSLASPRRSPVLEDTTLLEGSVPVTLSQLPSPSDLAGKYAAGDSSRNRGNQFIGSQVPEKRPLTEKRPLSTADLADDDLNEDPLCERKRAHRIDTPSRRNYHEFMVLDQAGPARMAYEHDKEDELVAIKRIKHVNTSSTKLEIPFTSDSVVSIRDMYLDDEYLMVIYEPMDISLRQATSILQGPLKHFHIAAICKRVKIRLVLICICSRENS